MIFWKKKLGQTKIMQKKIKNKVDKQTKSKVLKIIFSLFSRQNKIKNIISAFLIVCPTLTRYQVGIKLRFALIRLIKTK